MSTALDLAREDFERATDGYLTPCSVGAGGLPAWAWDDPEEGEPARVEQQAAAELCMSCSARSACLLVAQLDPVNEVGIRGGLTTAERERMARRQRRAERVAAERAAYGQQTLLDIEEPAAQYA